MRTKIGSHYGDDTLERYAMGDLPADIYPAWKSTSWFAKAARFAWSRQSSLFTWLQSCTQARVEQLRPARKGLDLAWLLGSPRGLFAGALAVLVMGLGIRSFQGGLPAPTTTSDVELQMVRGVGQDMSSHAAAGKLVLRADVTELRQMPVYVLQLVSGSGREIWKGRVNAVDQKVQQNLPMPIRAGTYLLAQPV